MTAGRLSPQVEQFFVEAAELPAAVGDVHSRIQCQARPAGSRRRAGPALGDAGRHQLPPPGFGARSCASSRLTTRARGTDREDGAVDVRAGISTAPQHRMGIAPLAAITCGSVIVSVPSSYPAMASALPPSRRPNVAS